MSITSASVVINFDGSINTNNPDATEFIPSVYPWMYDPNVESNWINCIVDCDKWVLSNWRGFDFHVPAILYRNNVIGDAKTRLKKLHDDAEKKYKEELAAWMLKNMPKDPNSFQMSYPPTNGKSVTFTVATHGVGANTSSSSSFTNNNPKATVDIPFTGANQSGAWSGNDNARACNVLPWQLFYDGIGVAAWKAPEVYDEWEHNIYAPTLSTTPSNYVIDGVAGTNGDAPMDRVKWWNGHQFLPFYCYYDTRFNSDKYPNEYAMHDIRFNWDTIQAPTQTLSVKDLGRLYYIPDPISPFPVPDYRVGRDVPDAFPCAVNKSTIYMHLAMGYIPPTGRQESRTSWKTGITFDITANCYFHPEDKVHKDGGRIEVKPFNISDKLGKSFLDNARLLSPVGDELWGQNGEHTVEIINLGTEAAIEIYDPQQVASNKWVRKYYDMQYYVPTYDKGEYLYRKKFAVVNPFPRDLQSAYMVIKYVKQYGHVGSKVVMDVVNPFDQDIILMHESTSFNGTDFEDESSQKTVNCVLIPKTTGNNPNVVTITLYGYWDFANWGHDFRYCLVPTKDYAITCDYGYVDHFYISVFRSTGMQSVNWRIKDAIQADSDAICMFPAFGLIWQTTAIKEPVQEVELPSLDDGGQSQGFPTPNSAYFGMASGQSCRADFYYYDTDTREETLYAANRKSHARLFTNNTYNNIANSSGLDHVLEAYISPDIDIVYHCPPNYSRRSALTWWLSAISPVYQPLYLGGAVATFCHKYDKLNTFGLEISTLSENQSTAQAYQGSNSIVIPFGSTFSKDKNGNPLPKGTPIEYNMLNTGGGVYIKGVKKDRLWCKNIVLTGSTPPILECAMVGRIVMGWDNTAIKVIIANYFYDPRN